MNKPSVLFVIYIFSLFQMPLLHSFEFLSYVDEIVVIWALYNLIKYINERNVYIYIILLIVGIAIYGIYCNFNARFQTEWVPILTDIGNCFKVFIAYMGAYVYFKHNKNKCSFGKFVDMAARFNYVFVSIMAMFFFVNLFYNIGMSPDTRFGLKSFGFIYGGASKFSSIFYLIIPILTFNFARKRTKRSQFFLFLSLALWLSTLRSKVLVFEILFILLYAYNFVYKKKFKLNIYNFFIGVIIAFFILEDQYYVYMARESSARYYFLVKGLQTAIDYFPFGTGFGTFGTDVAAKYYSELYYYYGMDHVYGLSPDSPKFSHDNYWPAILGQFGFIGLISFLLLLYLYFKDILFLSNKGRTLKMICTFFCACQLIASLSSPAFFTFMTVWQSFFIAFYINCSREVIYKA